MTPLRVGSFYVGKTPLTGWEFVAWSDGNQQWIFEVDEDRTIYIERVRTKRRRGVREKWHIVDRDDYPRTRYPPIIAGPFDNIKVAMLAARMML